MAEQARGEHAGVIDDEQVASAQVAREIADDAVVQRTGRAFQHEQPRCAARSRLLRDQIFREVEVEVGDEQGAPG